MSRHFKDVSHAIADWQSAWQMLTELSPNAAAGVSKGQCPGRSVIMRYHHAPAGRQAGMPPLLGYARQILSIPRPLPQGYDMRARQDHAGHL